jgi:hypothetical protein
MAAGDLSETAADRAAWFFSFVRRHSTAAATLTKDGPGKGRLQAQALVTRDAHWVFLKH